MRHMEYVQQTVKHMFNMLLINIENSASDKKRSKPDV
jgi:hypothetical protein